MELVAGRMLANAYQGPPRLAKVAASETILVTWPKMQQLDLVVVRGIQSNPMMVHMALIMDSHVHIFKAP
jgi:hypothetical protein